MPSEMENHSWASTVGRRLGVMIPIGLALLVVFNSLAFGGVHDVTTAITTTAVLVLFALMSIQRWCECPSREIGSVGSETGQRRLRRYLLPFLGVFLLAMSALPFLPLPESVLKLLSPNTWELTREALHDISDGPEVRWSTISVTPLKSVWEWTRLLSYVLFFIVLTAAIRTRHRARRFAWTLVILGLFLVLVAFSTVSAGITAKIYGLSRAHHASAVHSVFVNRNTFSANIGMLVPLALGLAFSMSPVGGGPSRFQTHMATPREFLTGLRPSQMFLVGFALLTTSAIFCLGSRGAVVALVGTLMVSIVLVSLLFRSKRLACYVIGLGAVLLLLGIWLRGEQYWQKFASISAKTPDRLWWWRDTVSIIWGFPLFGGGLGSFPTLFRVYKTEPTTWGFLIHPHSDYLNVAAEMGIVGFGLIAAVLVVLAVRSMNLVRRSSFPGRYLNVGCLVGATFILISSTFTTNFEVPANVFVFLSLLAIAQAPAEPAPISADRSEATGVCSRSSRWTAVARAAAAVVLACFLTCFAWRAYRARRLVFCDWLMPEAGVSTDDRITLLRKAVEIEPGFAEAHGNLGRRIERAVTESDKYTYAEACAQYLEAIRAEPLDAHYHFYLGSIYAHRGKECLGQQENRAESELKKARRLSPTEDLFAFSLGRYYQQKDRLEQAVASYRDSLRLRTMYLPQVFRAIWDKTGSLELLQMAIPAKAETQLLAVPLLIERKEGKAALAQVEYVMSLKDCDRKSFYPKIVRFLMDLGAWEKAETCLRDCVQLMPEDARLKLDLVEVLSKQKRFAEALAVLAEVLEQYPDNVQYLARAGDLCSQLERHDEAERYYASAAKLDPRYSPRLGRCYARRGELAEMVSLFNEWAARRPREAGPHRYLGLILEKMGNLTDALREFEKAAGLDPRAGIEKDITRVKEEIEKNRILDREKPKR